jgi:hypothetical protein
MALAVTLLVAVAAQLRTAVALTSSATFPLTPFVSTFSDGFLEGLDCAHLPMTVKLSVNQVQVPLNERGEGVLRLVAGKFPK